MTEAVAPTVTDAMIEAGIEAAWAHDPRDPPGFDEWQRDNARRIYLAMHNARTPASPPDAIEPCKGCVEVVQRLIERGLVHFTDGGIVFDPDIWKAPATSDDVERCITIAKAVREGFLSEEYAVDQPLSSFNERFACDQIIRAIADEFGITAMQPPQPKD